MFHGLGDNGLSLEKGDDGSRRLGAGRAGRDDGGGMKMWMMAAGLVTLTSGCGGMYVPACPAKMPQGWAAELPCVGYAHVERGKRVASSTRTDANDVRVLVIVDLDGDFNAMAVQP